MRLAYQQPKELFMGWEARKKIIGWIYCPHVKGHSGLHRARTGLHQQHHKSCR